MRRSDGDGHNSSAQQAAEQLRQASNLLAGTQQQLASGKMDSLAREAEQLRQEERNQAARIGKFVSQQDASSIDDLNAMLARRRELTQLAQDRQQLSDSLSNLQKSLRETAGQMAANQPGVAEGLRNALTEMDNSDLDNRVQRSADWLRRGIDPAANGTEDEIAQGLAKLSQQVQQAQKGVGQAKQGQQRGTWPGAGSDQAALVDQVERLRSEIESLAGSGARSGGNRGQAGQTGRAGRDGQPGPTGQGGQGQDGQTRQGGQMGRDGQNGSAGRQSGGAGARAGEDVGRQAQGNLSGDVRTGGGRSVDGTVWNNINTGNNQYGRPRQQSAPGDASANPADTEKDYQLGLRELNQLRQMAASDPQSAKDVAELTRQMQHLDPSRFPGNPAMVEQMHQEILTSLDRIELRFERDGLSSQARTGKPDSVPEGYQESVAEYYRHLSKSQ
jgi:hypothetical protein